MAPMALRGIYRDVIKEPDRGVVFDSGWNNNTIVDRCRMLLAGFMRSDASSGIKHLAVGQGAEAWDDSGIPPTDPAATIALTDQAADTPITTLDFTYLDDSDNPVSGPTQRLQVSATLDPGYPAPVGGGATYPLREFGLFGTFDSTDFMINCIRHPVIHKGPTATLIRVVRLHF